MTRALTRAVFRGALATAIVALALSRAGAESLVTAVSSDTVSIESNFTGTEIVVFGTIERDARTVSRRRGYDILIAARGPAQEITVREKERFAGIWVNRDSHQYVSAPSYVAFLANRALAEIADPLALTQFQLGLTHLVLLQDGGASQLSGDRAAHFRDATVRLMRERRRYLEVPYSVQFLSPSVFTARIPLPATIPIGTYAVEVYLFGDRALLQQATSKISIRKTGMEQIITGLASERPLLYGLGVVAMAIFSGWFASVVFRRD